MPMTVTSTAANGAVPMDPFVGPHSHTHTVPILASGLTTAEVDTAGYLKPGVPLSAAGALVGASVPVFGVTVEPIKIAASSAAGDLTAAGTVRVAVATIGQVNRAIMEANLGRVLTANEIAGFALAPCTIKLLA